MAAKLLLLQFYLFGYDCIKLHKKIFIVALATPQIFLLAFLVSLENKKFRYERVLQPSLFEIYIRMNLFCLLKDKNDLWFYLYIISTNGVCGEWITYHPHLLTNGLGNDFSHPRQQSARLAPRAVWRTIV